MSKIIDLSQEIYPDMPVYKGMPEVKMTVHRTHEEWDGLTNATTITPAVYRLELSEHTGTHVDALNHMARMYAHQSMETMPLSMFYTEGICLDFSHKGLRELIDTHELEAACAAEGLEIKPGDTVLIRTDHYRKHFNTTDWSNGPGITAAAARWLGSKKVAAFGVETRVVAVAAIERNSSKFYME